MSATFDDRDVSHGVERCTSSGSVGRMMCVVGSEQPSLRENQGSTIPQCNQRAPDECKISALYKRLQQFCTVKALHNIHSADVSMMVGGQTVVAHIEFPTTVPYFPVAPPVVTIQSHFCAPHEKYELLLSCHPCLAHTTWNLCFDVFQLFRDLIKIVETEQIRVMEKPADCDPEESLLSSTINVIQQTGLDVADLFPELPSKKLPSFGVARQPLRTPKPVTTTSKLHVSKDILVKYTNIAKLFGRVHAELATADPILTDAAYLIFQHTVTKAEPKQDFLEQLCSYNLACLLRMSGHALLSHGISLGAKIGGPSQSKVGYVIDLCSDSDEEAAPAPKPHGASAPTSGTQFDPWRAQPASWRPQSWRPLLLQNSDIDQDDTGDQQPAEAVHQIGDVPVGKKRKKDADEYDRKAMYEYEQMLQSVQMLGDDAIDRVYGRPSTVYELNTGGGANRIGNTKSYQSTPGLTPFVISPEGRPVPIVESAKRRF